MSKPPKKYALVGTSCVGKTTLVHKLSDLLHKDLPGIHIEVIEEAARIYFTYNKTDQPFSYFHQLQIQTLAKLQEQMAYFKNPHITLTDRSVLDAIAYVKAMGENSFAAKLLSKEKDWLPSYSHFFLLDPKGIPYKTDAVRNENKETRENFHKVFLDLLRTYKLPHTLVSGTLDARLNTIVQIIYSQLL